MEKYKLIYYLNTSCANRQPTTKEDIERDWIETELEFESDLKALEYVYTDIKNDEDDSEAAIQEFYEDHDALFSDVDKIEALYDYLDPREQDIGDGSVFIVELSKDNDVLLPNYFDLSKDDLLDEYADNSEEEDNEYFRQNLTLEEATILALQGKLTESITNYTLNDNDDCHEDVFISCYVSSTDEGRLMCIIPCKYDESKNRFEPSINDINFIYPSDGDEANPNDVDLEEIINKIPTKILNSLYALTDPDMAAKEQERKDKKHQVKLQELIKALRDLGIDYSKLEVDYSKFPEWQLAAMKTGLLQCKQLGFSDNILRGLANSGLYLGDTMLIELEGCLKIGVPEEDILNAIKKLRVHMMIMIM